MSMWLQNVGSFLEKLDDRAGRVVEERVVDDDDHLDSNVPEDVQLQSILSARGLNESKLYEEDDDDDNSGGENIPSGDKETLDDDFAEDPEVSNDNPVVEQPAVVDDTTSKLENESEEAALEMEKQEQFSSGNPNTGGPVAESNPSSQSEDQREMVREESSDAVERTAPQVSTEVNVAAADSGLAAQISSPNSHAALRESQREARTLRRHVVALNKQLEHAETELKAQREELERAAERLEKDRVRYKEEREKEKNRHADEIKSLKAQNDKAMKELKQRMDKQIEEVRKQLRDVEERRMQEGGDWNKELIDAVQREQEMAQKYALLEDEKGTLLSQITILQDQQEALGNRLESLSQTADNVMEREREAEARLDEALNLHARQIAQRQARESELERTVAELGAALVVARSSNSSSTNGTGGSSKLRQDDAFVSSSPEALVQTLQHELEGLVAQLNFEKQRCETLQNELRDVSRERTEETAANHARQIKDDRKIAELSHTIARLESEQRGGNRHDSVRSLSAESGDSQQMMELSEEVIRLREKVANCNSEISALKSRLKVANEREQRAESALESSKRIDDDFRDLEQSPVSGDGMRRRAGGSSSRHSQRNSNEVSMRAALHLDAMRGQGAAHGPHALMQEKAIPGVADAGGGHNHLPGQPEVAAAGHH
ncbi:hypothetical protein ACA910_019660 [Epithemia clementina (nom. ined.)]